MIDGSNLMAAPQDESSRIQSKIDKVTTYWNKTSLLIPNVFRLARLIDEDPDHLLEHQDLSKKELLVQSNGQKTKTSTCEEESETSEDEAKAKLKEKTRTERGDGFQKKTVKKLKGESRHIYH